MLKQSQFLILIVISRFHNAVHNMQYNFISPSYIIHVKHRTEEIYAYKKSYGDINDTNSNHTRTLMHT